MNSIVQASDTRPGGGTLIAVHSRSFLWPWSDSGCDCANLVNLLGTFGIDAR